MQPTIALIALVPISLISGSATQSTSPVLTEFLSHITVTTIPNSVVSSTASIVVVPEPSTTITQTLSFGSTPTFSGSTTITFIDNGSVVTPLPTPSQTMTTVSSNVATTPTSNILLSTAVQTSTQNQSSGTTLPSITITGKSNGNSSTTTAILAGVLIPIGAIILFCIGFYLRKHRNNKKWGKDGGTKESSSKQPPPEMQLVARGPPSPSCPPNQPPHAVVSSFDRNGGLRTGSRPTRLERPLSPELIIENTKAHPQSHLHDSHNEGSIKPLDSSSQRMGFRYSETIPATPPAMSPATMQRQERPQAYDGTRNLFYETALNRNLPFDQLARSSLQIDNRDDERTSMTPPPLNIIKRNESDPGGPRDYSRHEVHSPRSERRKVSPQAGRNHVRGTPIERGLQDIEEQKPYELENRPSQSRPSRAGPSEARPSQGHRRHGSRTDIEYGTYSLMNDRGSDPDDEEILRHREYTLDCLEGYVPQERPSSSIYSQDIFGMRTRPQPSYADRWEMERLMVERRRMDELELERLNEARRQRDTRDRDMMSGKGKGKARDMDGDDDNWI